MLANVKVESRERDVYFPFPQFKVSKNSIPSSYTANRKTEDDVLKQARSVNQYAKVPLKPGLA